MVMFFIDRRTRAMLPVLLLLSAVCVGQSTPGNSSANSSAKKPPDTAQCPAAPADKPCSTQPEQKKHPSASEKFPFPGEPETPASNAGASNAPTPDAPAPAAPGAPRPNAAREHPFPGEPSPEGSSSSSSSSSSSGDDTTTPAASDDHPWVDKGDNPDAATKQPARRRLPKVQNPQSDEERATEDLSVAKFYEDQGNLNAAYLRLKDAVQYQPNDPYVHFALAQMTQKMNKREEAIAEFQTYLRLDPDGLKIKQAKKALAQLQR
jgi:hypothetical protein